MIRAVILDVDGTLIDSNDAHAWAWLEALDAHGIRVSFAAVRQRIGMGGDQLLPSLTGIAADSDQGRGISAERRAAFHKRLSSLRTQPGARRLIDTLRARGLTVVVASSAERGELAALLSVIGATDLLPAATSSDDAARSKPAPDVVAAALARAGCRPDEAILVGDTPFDIASARRAGVPVIALRCGGWDDVHLAGAIAIFDDPADLVDHLDRTPFAGVSPTAP